MAVGIFDSGLGGLTVLDAVARRLPDVAFVYYGDNAHAPYGVRDADDIFNLTCRGVERLWAEGCDLVILACNTASAAALKRMQESWVPEGRRVLGVFVPLIEALTERHWGDNSPPREVAVKHVALFATPATVASRAFQRELASGGVEPHPRPLAVPGPVDLVQLGVADLGDLPHVILPHQQQHPPLCRHPEQRRLVLAATHPAGRGLSVRPLGHQRFRVGGVIRAGGTQGPDRGSHSHVVQHPDSSGPGGDARPGREG